MFNSSRGVHKIAVLYYVLLIVLGQIILLKLFLAVLLENYEENRKQLLVNNP